MVNTASSSFGKEPLERYRDRMAADLRTVRQMRPLGHGLTREVMKGIRETEEYVRARVDYLERRQRKQNINSIYDDMLDGLSVEELVAVIRTKDNREGFLARPPKAELDRIRQADAESMSKTAYKVDHDSYLLVAKGKELGSRAQQAFLLGRTAARQWTNVTRIDTNPQILRGMVKQKYLKWLGDHLFS